jgi:hypothetical protein
MPLVKQFFFGRPMRFIILFPIFIHIITPTLMLLFVITSSSFVLTKPMQCLSFPTVGFW